MGSKLYVGGLPYSATQDELTDLFSANGTMASANIISDKFTGQSRGFGFVEMPKPGEAKFAMQAINGKEIDGYKVRVKKATVWFYGQVGTAR